MTLYLYQTKSHQLLTVLRGILSYTDTIATAEDGTIYGPFAENCELSETQDCTGTLRADWRSTHPSTDARLEELEFLMAEMLFGGVAK